jgi:hypothetical protein
VRSRIRFVVETLEAMAAAAGGASRVGIKISPAMPFNDIQDDDPIETYTTLVKAIAPMGLAYLHVLRTPPLPNIFQILRPLFSGPFAAGGGFEQQSGNAMLESGGADVIVFGKLFTSNPDLPDRFAAGAPLTRNVPDSDRPPALRRRSIVVTQDLTDPLTPAHGTTPSSRGRTFDQLVADALMIALMVIVLDKLPHQAAQMPLAYRNDAIEAFRLDRPDKTLRVRVAVRRCRRRAHDANANGPE